MPVGAGTLLLGAYYGFQALLQAGEIPAMPKVFGVQSTACPPLAEAFTRGAASITTIQLGTSSAEGVQTPAPPRASEILASVRTSRGAITAVDDDDLWIAFAMLARVGLFVEPTAALPVAGYTLLRREGRLESDELTVLVATGSGLKASSTIAAHLDAGSRSYDRGECR